MANGGLWLEVANRDTQDEVWVLGGPRENNIKSRSDFVPRTKVATKSEIGATSYL